MAVSLHETCQQYVARRLSEGWSVVWQKGYHLILSSPDSNILRPVDLRNDVETLRPNAAGDENAITSQWPADSFPATAHWDKVDETTPDETSTEVYTNSATYLRDLYNIADHSEGQGTIGHITVHARCKGNYAGGLGLKIAIKSGTGTGAPDTVREGSEKTLAVSYDNYSEQWSLNPATSSAWTWDEIDKLQIGIALKKAALSGFCTQVYVEVDYTPYTVHEKTLTDGIALTDTLVKTPMLFKSDGLALADVLVKTPIKFLSDGIAFTDVLEKYRLLIKVLTDGIAFTDTLVKTISKTLTDGIAFRDVISYVKNPTKLAKLIRKYLQLEDIGGGGEE